MAEDTRQDKRANFSALTDTNGMTRTSSMSSGKSGSSKKLVIKNFKGIVLNTMLATVTQFYIDRQDE